MILFKGVELKSLTLWRSLVFWKRDLIWVSKIFWRESLIEVWLESVLGILRGGGGEQWVGIWFISSDKFYFYFNLIFFIWKKIKIYLQSLKLFKNL